MTQTASSAPRRLVMVGRYEAGTPVYAFCDPDLLIAGTTAVGKSQATAGHMPVGRAVATHNRLVFRRPVFVCTDLGDSVLHVRRAGERP